MMAVVVGVGCFAAAAEFGAAKAASGSAPHLTGSGVTFIIWLSGGPKNVPDPRVLREGDAFVVRAHTAEQALGVIGRVRDRLQGSGVEPAKFKYIVRTFPADLTASGSVSGKAPFFATASPDVLKDLRETAFAIMFDHERVWYARSRDRLPAWRWDYDWTIRQVSTLANEISSKGFRPGTLVTPAGEARWVGPAGAMVPEGFAALLDSPKSQLDYLIVQAQPFCRNDPTGRAYGSFAARVIGQMGRLFGPKTKSKMPMLALQLSIDDGVDPVNRKANYVPPDWAMRCLAASLSGRDLASSVRAYFLWSRSRKATCEVIKLYRRQADVQCE